MAVTSNVPYIHQSIFKRGDNMIVAWRNIGTKEIKRRGSIMFLNNIYILIATRQGFPPNQPLPNKYLPRPVMAYQRAFELALLREEKRQHGPAIDPATELNDECARRLFSLDERKGRESIGRSNDFWYHKETPYNLLSSHHPIQLQFLVYLSNGLARSWLYWLAGK